ncbi:hypothetical protein BS47DRAFT_1139294 [Hydnum rufescens UP504]|uniref:Uncharacterized protein n=1 Tax=Hydnum rufescens UP504 TaxID=1448309 RepID=A0A9P6AUM2_9AGAM|nr:hypothetical protein BS47DRAFT_1139294 [Hydnum rufescens UP504]
MGFHYSSVSLTSTTTRRIWSMEVSQVLKHTYIIYVCLHYCIDRVNERPIGTKPSPARLHKFISTS